MASVQCWCGRSQHSAEVRCSECKSYIHYECLGLSWLDFSAHVNQQPGIYLCRACGPKTTKKAREALRRNNPGNSIFEFNHDVYQYNTAPSNPCPVVPMADLEKAIDQRVATLETRVLTAITDTSATLNKSVNSYSSAVKQGLENKQHLVRNVP